MSPSRRRRAVLGGGESAGSGFLEQPHRHPAMTGIVVSPVHGRHCICGRCESQAPKPN